MKIHLKKKTCVANLQLQLKSVVLWLGIYLKEKLFLSPKLLRFFFVQTMEAVVTFKLQKNSSDGDGL